ncbi:MAG: ATP synthase F1 subunit gamma [Patescibacteria group bacterium]
MPATRDITRRIKSVKNTRKITKAMELVAAAKMRKAVDAVLATRPYAQLSWATVSRLARRAGQGQVTHPLLKQRGAVKRIAIILVTSNRGLCGGFNSNLLQKVVQSVELYRDIETDFILLGKKGELVYRRYGYQVTADYPKDDVITRVDQVGSVAHEVIADYRAGKYDKVLVAYTDFISSLQQLPRLRQLLPVAPDDVAHTVAVVTRDRIGAASPTDELTTSQAEFADRDYLFEPNPAAILEAMIPRLVEIQLFQALLESNASEHSARMMAMSNATEAADDMIKELTLSYNKARQASITSEIAEIAGGAAALAN